MVSSPNRAFFQIESEGITPSSSTPRNSHECVVCNLFPLFKKTETTFGRSVIRNHFQIKRKTKQRKAEENRAFYIRSK